MKRLAKIVTVALALTFAAAYPVLASDKGHEKHGGHNHSAHQEMKHSEDSSMEHSGHAGNKIREAHVEGYHFTYELIDMREKMKGMKGMPEMKNTHHLMVYVKDAHEKAVSNAKVGYLIQGPDNTKQKAMCMGMGGGFGADVNLGAAGKYTVKTKVMAGESKLMDEFEYEVK